MNEKTMEDLEASEQAADWEYQNAMLRVCVTESSIYLRQAIVEEQQREIENARADAWASVIAASIAWFLILVVSLGV